MWEIWVRSQEGSPSSKDLKVFLLFSRKEEEEEVVTLPSSSLFPPSPFGTFRLLLLPGNYCRRLLPVPRKNSLREEKAGKRMGRKLGVYFPLRFPSEKRAGRGKEIESPSASLHRLLAIWLPSGLGSLSISPPFPPENPSRKRNTHETTIDLPSPPIFLFSPFLIPFSFLFLPFISEIQLSFHPLSYPHGLQSFPSFPQPYSESSAILSLIASPPRSPHF